MSKFLLELYSEEMPADMQDDAEIGYKNIFCDVLEKNGLQFGAVYPDSGPCRISVLIENLSYKVDSSNIIRGPKIDSPQEAINGFCKKHNVEEQNLVKEYGYYFFIEKKEKYQKSLDFILKEVVPDAIKKYVWPKSMYWGESKISWVRPLRNILCLLDNKVLPIKYGHLEANNITYGHKFIKFGEIPINHIDSYKSTLENNFVILSRSNRKRKIQDKLQSLGVFDYEKLLEEVVGLVEFPVVLSGNFSADFLSLPEEVLVTVMRKHQRYFPTKDTEGKLTNAFVFVSNNPNAENNTIIAGNEKVLLARLADAKYLYEQDLKVGIDEFYKRLDGVVFHNKLGTLLDKTNRLESIARWIISENVIDIENLNIKDEFLIAVKYCKCDLVSQVVMEFPELQGIMGKYYALNANLDERIANAIGLHYCSSDEIKNKIGTMYIFYRDSIEVLAYLVALIDRLDSLVGLFIAGERADGNKDPHGLRRLAIGIINIIVDAKLNINLSSCIKYIINLHDFTDLDSEKVFYLIDNFIIERANHVLKNKGYTLDIIHFNITIISSHNSIKNSLLGEYNNILEIFDNIKILDEFIKSSNWQDLLDAYTRLFFLVGGSSESISKELSPKFEEIRNNLLKVGDKEKREKNFEPNVRKTMHNIVRSIVNIDLFEYDEEKGLYDFINNIVERLGERTVPYKEELVYLTDLHVKINALLNNVKINSSSDKLTKNRHKLLYYTKDVIDYIIPINTFVAMCHS